MASILIKSNQLKLPEKIAKKLKGKRVELFETQEGILLKPVQDAIKEARGFLKGTNISSQKYMQLKKEEKELEATLDVLKTSTPTTKAEWHEGINNILNSIAQLLKVESITPEQPDEIRLKLDYLLKCYEVKWAVIKE